MCSRECKQRTCAMPEGPNKRGTGATVQPANAGIELALGCTPQRQVATSEQPQEAPSLLQLLLLFLAELAVQQGCQPGSQQLGAAAAERAGRGWRVCLTHVEEAGATSDVPHPCKAAHARLHAPRTWLARAAAPAAAPRQGHPAPGLLVRQRPAGAAGAARQQPATGPVASAAAAAPPARSCAASGAWRRPQLQASCRSWVARLPAGCCAVRARRRGGQSAAAAASWDARGREAAVLHNSCIGTGARLRGRMAFGWWSAWPHPSHGPQAPAGAVANPVAAGARLSAPAQPPGGARRDGSRWSCNQGCAAGAAAPPWAWGSLAPSLLPNRCEVCPAPLQRGMCAVRRAARAGGTAARRQPVPRDRALGRRRRRRTGQLAAGGTPARPSFELLHGRGQGRVGGGRGGLPSAGAPGAEPRSSRPWCQLPCARTAAGNAC